MKPTVTYIEQRFDEFNRQMFGGRLPRIPIELSDAKTFLGLCVSKIRRHTDGRAEHFDFRLRINTRIDLPESEVEDTIIHEMIHYFIGYNGLHDTSVHGAIFKSIMASINRNFNRHLTVSHKGTPEQREQAVSDRPSWHIIAVMHHDSGRKSVKVLPRVAPKVVKFAGEIVRCEGIRAVDLYLHNDPYFNRFPTSTALRIFYVEKDVLDTHLKGAHRLVVENGTLRQC